MKTKEEKISTILLLEILTKYAAKHAVAFSGVESNSIIEAMYEYASDQTQKLTVELSFALGQIDLYRELVEAQQKYINKADSIMGNWECSHAELVNQRLVIGRIKKELGL